MSAWLGKDEISSNKLMNNVERDIRMLQISCNILDIENGKLKKEILEVKEANQKVEVYFSKIMQECQNMKEENYQLKLENRLLMAEFDSLRSQKFLCESCSSNSSKHDEDEEFKGSDNENDDMDDDADDELDVNFFTQRLINENRSKVSNLSQENSSSEDSDKIHFSNNVLICPSIYNVRETIPDHLYPLGYSTPPIVLLCSLLVVCLQLLVMDNLLFQIPILISNMDTR